MKNVEIDSVESFAGWAVFGIVLGLLSMMITGCGSTTGWRVSFGVAPVSQIRDVASLQGNQSDARIVKRAPAPKSGNTAEDDY